MMPPLVVPREGENPLHAREEKEEGCIGFWVKGTIILALINYKFKTIQRSKSSEHPA